MFDEHQDKGSIVGGIGLTLLLHFFQLPIGFVLALVASVHPLLSLFFIGLSQCLYMIPAIVHFRKTGETETAKGLIIGASITFLLNATCTAIVFGSLNV
jgi:hypothetical protein